MFYFVCSTFNDIKQGDYKRPSKKLKRLSPKFSRRIKQKTNLDSVEPA